MSNPVVSSTNHPSDETLAALVDGRLDEQTRKTIIEHIATCDDCHAVWMAVAEANETLDLDETSKPANVTEGHFGRGRWYSLIAVAAAIAIGFALWPYAQTYRNRDAVIEASAAREDRPSPARLSGDHPYRVAEPTLRSTDDNGSERELYAVYGLAGKIEKQAQKQRTAETFRQLAAIRLLVEDWDGAVTAAEEAIRLDTGVADVLPAIRKSTNAELLNDVAAVHYARATRRHEAQADYAAALNASRRSVELQKTPHSLWNYALALEAAGFRSEARRVWIDYLQLDPSSPWAEEARGRLQALDEPAAAFRQRSTRQLKDALTRRDEAVVRALVIAHPMNCRIAVEEDLLPAWGRDPTEANLAAAEFLAALVHQHSQDSLSFDAIRAIRAAPPPCHRRLAAAHRSYGTARDLARTRPSEALLLYRSALPDFEACGSPFAILTRVRVAGCVHRQMAYDDALRMITYDVPQPDALADRGYLALAAQAAWTRGTVEVELSLHESALSWFEKGLSWFVRLREVPNQTSIRARAAQAADSMGSAERALYHRLEALRIHASVPLIEQATILVEAATGLSTAGYADAAEVVFDRLFRVSQQLQDPYADCVAFLWRSVHQARNGNQPVAERLFRESLQPCASVTDPARRTRVAEVEAFVGGMIAEGSQSALASLDQAVAIAETSGSRFRRALLYARRSELHREQKNVQAARADAARAMTAVIEPLQAIKDRETRGRWLAAAQDTVDSRIAAELEAGEFESAFAASEWQRIAADPEALSPSLAQLQRSLRPGVAIVAFHLGRRRLTTFVIRAAFTHAHVADLARVALEHEIDAFRDAIVANHDAVIADRGRSLYRSLILPLLPRLDGIRALIIIPDEALASLPFAALLVPDGTPLLEAYTISTAPSAASIAGVRSCSRPNARDRAVIVAGARRLKDGEQALSDAEREIRAVAALYSDVRILLDETATPEAFLDASEYADVMYYTGHASMNERQPLRSALVLSDRRNGPRFVYAHQIVERDWTRVRLLILAACSTGRRGSFSRAGSSLAQTFLDAGVQSVIGTLWDVEDTASREIATRLHAAAATGATLADALRTVQLRMRNSPSTALREPRAWAAWNAIGGCNGSAQDR